MGVNEFQMPHALLMVSNEQRLHSLTTTLDQGPLVGVFASSSTVVWFLHNHAATESTWPVLQGLGKAA